MPLGGGMMEEMEWAGQLELTSQLTAARWGAALKLKGRTEGSRWGDVVTPEASGPWRV